jgi:hypothetical protein
MKMIAKGKKGQMHKVRKKADLKSDEVGKVKSGQKVDATKTETVTKDDGTVVVRIKLSKPKGWVTASNFGPAKKGK